MLAALGWPSRRRRWTRPTAGWARTTTSPGEFTATRIRAGPSWASTGRTTSDRARSAGPQRPGPPPSAGRAAGSRHGPTWISRSRRQLVVSGGGTDHCHAAAGRSGRCMGRGTSGNHPSSCTAPPFPSPGGGHAALVVLPGPGDVPTQPFAAPAVSATNTLCSATMIDRPPTTGGAGPSRLMPSPEPAAAVALEATGGKHHPRV